ncbi:hypothetical protein RCG17_27235 [Neobacillus sp. PS3-12]|nr:hypothetical protein [Neobacillus sp. PS3-12]WML52992.1 hypothetical protein RCG17_27235 [Neobacillus sp. PS3-12]
MTGILLVERETETEVENKYEFVEYIGLTHVITKLASGARDEE